MNSSAARKSLEELRFRPRLGWRAKAIIASASVVLLTFGVATPAQAASAHYGFGNCLPKTVVSVTTSTVNATHVNFRLGVARQTSWGNLFLFLPETRRAYPNWTYVQSTDLYTAGTLVSSGRECS